MRTLTPVPLSEDALIAAIAEAVGKPARPLRVGIGDDAAAWQPSRNHWELITGDMLVDGVHFRLEGTSAEALGHKALAKNLSDIAAMAGRPVLAVVALALTNQIDEPWIRGFYRGMAALAARVRCTIAGGDIVHGPAFTVAITIVGEVRKTSIKLRSGAKPGDIIAVTGPLGLAAAGLKLLDAGLTMKTSRAALAYLQPQPRLAEGAFFGSSRATHALMDISDGLSTDVARMARASSADAVIEHEKLYVHPELRDSGMDPIDMILNGGDDYELLAAIDERSFPYAARAFERRFGRPLASVGHFESGDGKAWIEHAGTREPLPPGGYDHVRNV